MIHKHIHKPIPKLFFNSLANKGTQKVVIKSSKENPENKLICKPPGVPDMNLLG